MTFVAPIRVENSVTKLNTEHRGCVLIAGSHGGRYAAYLALRAGVRAAILNDAGVGRERAGISGLRFLEENGVPAAAAAHSSCRIGDGQDAVRRGVVSAANSPAVAIGVAPGMKVSAAARLLAERAEERAAHTALEAENRVVLRSPGGEERGVVLIDSASLVEPEDKGLIVVTGSHGGLLGGDPDTALRVDAFAAVFNDAGIGIEEAGLSRLPVLDSRGIAAATVSAWSARIGEGRSTYEHGFISHVNATAQRRGAEIGMSASEFVRLMYSAARAPGATGKLVA
jgi:hypothetical protein